MLSSLGSLQICEILIALKTEIMCTENVWWKSFLDIENSLACHGKTSA
jgi:hypothetical protein